jgi:hypothetical protein
VRAKVVRAVEQRSEVISARNLDVEFCRPDANWKDYLECPLYKFMRDGGYEVVNRLRFYVSYYSGYQLFSLTDVVDSPFSFNEVPIDYDDWITKRLSHRDFWTNLWQQEFQGFDSQLIYSPPKMLGEVGWEINGVVVNHDTYVYQERINLLRESGILAWLRKKQKRDQTKILEIGGGYGALASFLQPISKSQYFICDLPESLLFSGIYLSLRFPDKKLLVCLSEHDLKATEGYDYVLVPNYLFHSLQGMEIDLAVNTLSMAELSIKQISVYCEGISKLIGGRGVFFEQNHNCFHGSVQNLPQFKEYLGQYFKYNFLLAEIITTRTTQGICHLRSNCPPSTYLPKLLQAGSLRYRFNKYKEKFLTFYRTNRARIGRRVRKLNSFRFLFKR